VVLSLVDDRYGGWQGELYDRKNNKHLQARHDGKAQDEASPVAMVIDPRAALSKAVTDNTDELGKEAKP
jgi:hypothetical protein